MEDWTWPPRYDNKYRPHLRASHWFPQRETMPEDQRNELIVARLRDVMTYAWENSSFYRKKWEDAGIHPSMITDLDAFERVPVITKDELRREQALHEPFGEYLCVPLDQVKHVNGTSGTTGRPTAFGISSLDWNNIANAHARVMWGMGIRPSDTVLISSFFSLYLGSWGALIGAERLGARVFPFGAGATGQTVRAVQWIQQMRPTVLYSTPSYSLRLAEVAAESHVDPASFGLRRLFFSGEPGASVPTIRTRIEELYAAEVFDCGSMAEVTPWMALAETTGHVGMLAWQDLVYAEVCDPVRFTRLPYGGEGTPVYTTLERTSQPMIRLVSNDLTKWEAPSSPCGRTYPVFPRGIYGRIDDMFTIRGENIYPSAIDDVVMGEAGYGGEHRIIISRSESMDELTVQVEYDNEVAAADATAATRWAIRLSERLRSTLGVRTTVVPVPPYTLERTEFKARRVIDDREMFRTVRESASGTTSLR